MFSADLLSRFSQQIFSADLLSRSSHLSYHLLWSGVGGQLLSYHSYHLPWSGVGGQLLSYRLLWSGVGGQLLSYHLLWSGVGGQLLSYHVGGQYCTSSLEGPFRGAFGNNHELVRDKPSPCLTGAKSKNLPWLRYPHNKKENHNCHMLISVLKESKYTVHRICQFIPKLHGAELLSYNCEVCVNHPRFTRSKRAFRPNTTLTPFGSGHWTARREDILRQAGTISKAKQNENMRNDSEKP